MNTGHIHPLGNQRKISMTEKGVTKAEVIAYFCVLALTTLFLISYGK